MSEAYIEDGVVASAEAAGWIQRKLCWTGRTGAPDRIFMKQGVVVFMEFKDNGKRCVGQQLREMRRLAKSGVTVFWDVDSIVQGCGCLGCRPLRSLVCFK